MNKTININNKLLIKKVFIMLFFLITYFILQLNVKAASFNYSDFNFKNFASENKGYWTDICAEEDDSEKCAEKIIYAQKDYYTRLYKILAKYEKKGHKIDDNIIIMTTFFGLTPDLFSDEGKSYNELFGLDNKAYNYDPSNNLDDYDVDADPDLDILQTDTDTLDVLIKSMFSYTATCYANYGNISQVTTEDGSPDEKCLNGGSPESINGKTKCATKISNDTLGFWEYIGMKIGGAGFFGIKRDEEKKCLEKSSEYPGADMEYIRNKKKQFTPDKYWEFLEEGTYFDNKAHLSSYFKSVLLSTEKSSMKELSESEYETFDEEIKSIRKDIVLYIKSILLEHGSKTAINNLTNVNNALYWWPIGSSEVTTSGDVTFASGEPSTVQITSNFGPRIHPVTKIADTFHYGVDIAGGREGVANIIAVRDGIVITVSSSCSSPNDTTCGGYGNYVVVSHGDGNFTYYAHLYEGSVTVTENQSVVQGQVLGKMGHTGRSTGPHLHFEVRVGSNDASAAVNPLNYISPDDPRQNSVSSSDLVSMLICIEGSGPDDGGSNYKVYDDSHKGTGTLTVGPGIALIYNVERFTRRGLDVNKYMFEGALIPKSVVDDIKAEVIENLYDSINSKMNSENITLLPYQTDALVSRQYNVGNINKFPASFKTYGNTQGLYDNYMGSPVTGKGLTGPVLKKRRDLEWKLFHTGIYHSC